MNSQMELPKRTLEPSKKMKGLELHKYELHQNWKFEYVEQEIYL